ncbi:hypothetical protein NMYAN_130062 [Nitrosomonas nitrosa]|uniref:Uncharacterized protein n=1 Tax=Nitrosomonas nitrosa TaxID=52442 RepID=A0A8H9D876_9PROT|nr:hypothetical protein NMYAN_130062 [Nitrosomonas nitrosa]
MTLQALINGAIRNTYLFNNTNAIAIQILSQQPVKLYSSYLNIWHRYLLPLKKA